MRRDASSPAAYRAAVEGRLAELLDEIRDVIFEACPQVEEGIEHGMLDYPGLANLAAQKDFVAVYVAPEVLARHRAEFPGVSAGKSCLRFRRRSQVDREALARLFTAVWAIRGGSEARG